jgi:hypothetical protein
MISSMLFRLTRIRLCKSEAAAAAEAAGAAASVAAVAAAVAVPFVAAADTVVVQFVVPAIVVVSDIAVVSGTAEERSLEGAWWVPLLATAPAIMAAAMAAITVIHRTNIAVEAPTTVAATVETATMVAGCIVAAQW